MRNIAPRVMTKLKGFVTCEATMMFLIQIVVIKVHYSFSFEWIGFHLSLNTAFLVRPLRYHIYLRINAQVIYFFIPKDVEMKAPIQVPQVRAVISAS